MSTHGIENLYSLLQAFEITGKRIFQNKWTGQEALAAPENDPNPIDQRREEIETRLVRIRRELRAIGQELEDQLSDLERREIGSSSRELYAERDALTVELNTLPKTSGSWFKDFAAFERRRDVEKLLHAAFKDGDLTIHLITGLQANYGDWIKKPHFYISFPQSLVMCPASNGWARRRYPAYVSKDAIEAWLDRYAADPMAAGELSTEEKCALWLKTETKGPKGNRVKADFLNEAQELFPELSERAFNMVWARTVPDAWKKPIRPR